MGTKRERTELLTVPLQLGPEKRAHGTSSQAERKLDAGKGGQALCASRDHLGAEGAVTQPLC